MMPGMDRSRLLLLGLVATLPAAPAAAQSGSASGTIDVSLTVLPSCQVETAPLAFEGRAGSMMDAQSRIVVGCNGDMPISVAIDGGSNGSSGERRLAGALGFVPYAIYSDAARRVRWDASAPLAARAGTVPLELVAYGRIEPQATGAMLGTFNDSLTVTVEF